MAGKKQSGEVLRYPHSESRVSIYKKVINLILIGTLTGCNVLPMLSGVSSPDTNNPGGDDVPSSEIIPGAPVSQAGDPHSAETLAKEGAEAEKAVAEEVNVEQIPILEPTAEPTIVPTAQATPEKSPNPDPTEVEKLAADPDHIFSIRNFQLWEGMGILTWEADGAELDPTLLGTFNGFPEGTRIFFRQNPKEISRFSISNLEIFINFQFYEGEEIIEIDHSFLNLPDNNGQYGLSVNSNMVEGDEYFMVVRLPKPPEGDDFEYGEDRYTLFEVSRDLEMPNNDPVLVYQYVKKLLEVLDDSPEEDWVVFKRTSGDSSTKQACYHFVDDEARINGSFEQVALVDSYQSWVERYFNGQIDQKEAEKVTQALEKDLDKSQMQQLWQQTLDQATAELARLVIEEALNS